MVRSTLKWLVQSKVVHSELGGLVGSIKSGKIKFALMSTTSLTTTTQTAAPAQMRWRVHSFIHLTSATSPQPPHLTSAALWPLSPPGFGGSSSRPLLLNLLNRLSFLMATASSASSWPQPPQPPHGHSLLSLLMATASSWPLLPPGIGGKSLTATQGITTMSIRTWGQRNPLERIESLRSRRRGIDGQNKQPPEGCGRGA